MLSSNSSHLNLLFLNANYVNVSKGLISYIYEKDYAFTQTRPEFEKLAPASKVKNQQTTPPHTHTHIERK